MVAAQTSRTQIGNSTGCSSIASSPTRQAVKDVKRPQLEALLGFVRDGDVVFVHSMDRLARNLDDLRRIMKDLTDRGVRIEFIKEALVFTGDDSPMATLLLSMLGTVAEFERSLLTSSPS
jgi:DNA invertase Pin-like site-specific DNA recombinase